MSEYIQKLNYTQENIGEIRAILQNVYQSLLEKGYSPITQLAGYILTGDPTYITNYNHARQIIQRVDRDMLMQVLLQDYLKDS
ncbi:IreB family regulatory phosphoprotein [Bengtsoniella intestinalis]|uniref:IreB family regulatory phosphoprotein n=1 Tax=Bengtsoniella intestinalis TaxID=3073143 RepID=UPI00391F75F8